MSFTALKQVPWESKLGSACGQLPPRGGRAGAALAWVALIMLCWKALPGQKYAVGEAYLQTHP